MKKRQPQDLVKEGGKGHADSVKDWSDDSSDEEGLDWSSPDQADLNDFSDDEVLEWPRSEIDNAASVQRERS